MASHPVYYVSRETRKWRWAMFVLGNLITVAVTVSEISGLSVCFEETLGDDDDDTPEENALSTKLFLMITLVFGLWVDVISALALSAIYHSPLDIKSAHKIPPGDMRHCGGTCLIRFLSPFSWGLVYFFGGLASWFHGEHSPCGGGAGGSGLAIYLYVSGALMFLLVTFVMMALSIVMVLVACLTACCGSSTRPNCCVRVRDCLHRRIMSISPLLDLGWQLQGIILSYRTGSVDLATAVLLATSGVLGEVLAACGSMAPKEVQELV